jgi:uncharacterized protein
METTRLNREDRLPLTCSRTGTCCHGKMVWLNPWELFCLARTKGITPREFRNSYCEYGGIRLRFDGKAGWKSQQACSQYIENYGCSVHAGRPLSCRLYPLGRQIQSNEVHYMYQGQAFPCLEGCPEVTALPYLKVEEYLAGQQTDQYEKAQDEYLELMQNIADIAFVLLLDTGLAASGDKETLRMWRQMGDKEPDALAQQIGTDWMDSLTLPEIAKNTNDPVLFIRQHGEMLQQKAQNEFGALNNATELHQASVLVMGLALQLSRAIGADTAGLANLWADTAKENGAQE